MKVKKKVPELRFPEFSGEWEEKRLGDVSKVSQGLQIPIRDRLTKPKYGSYFYITNEFLKENSKTKYYINNPPKSVICNKNDILMTRTGNTGIIVTNVSGAFHNNFFKIDYDKSVLNRDFLIMALSSKRMQKDILIAAGQSTIPDLNHSDFYKLKIYFPSLPEQQKIGNFLSTLDKRIELQQQKVENLEKEKKGIMQKIFSQEIRFKDENGNDYPEWEEKRLGDLGNFYNGLSGKTKDDFVDGNSKFITYMNVFQNTISNKKMVEYVKVSKKEKQNKVKYGDILFTQSSETLEEVGMSSVWIGDADCYLNSFCFGFRFKDLYRINPIYVGFLLRSNKMRKRIILEGQGSTRYNLASSRLANVKLDLPSLPEQQKIADFLSTFDDKIEKEKEKLEQLRELKKSLLQKMFV